MEGKQYRTVSYAEQNAKEGALFETWNGKWGLKIYPWYSMDKLRFSFIEKGVGDKSKSFDISISTIKNGFMDIESMKHEVLRDIRCPYEFTAVMGLEKNAEAAAPKGTEIPHRYMFQTGEKGEKKLTFLNSTSAKEYCIKGESYVNGSKVSAMIPVSWHDVYSIMKAYDETYAARRTFLHDELMKGIEKQEKESEKYRNSWQDSDYEGPEQSEEDASQQNASDPQEPPRFTLSVRSASPMKELKSGGFAFKAYDAGQRKITVGISKETANTLSLVRQGDNDLFSKLKETVERGGTFEFSGHLDAKAGVHVLEMVGRF